MDDNFSPRVKDVIAYSKEEALRLGHDFIGTEHLMLGLLRDGSGKAINILNALDIDLNHLRRKVEILSPANPNITVSSNQKKNLHLTRQAERALKTTFLEGTCGSTYTEVDVWQKQPSVSLSSMETNRQVGLGNYEVEANPGGIVGVVYDYLP